MLFLISQVKPSFPKQRIELYLPENLQFGQI